MIDKIGTAAGEVWRYLDENGPATATAIKKSLDLPQAAIERAIGWLAREDKVQEIKEGRLTKIEAL